MTEKIVNSYRILQSHWRFYLIEAWGNAVFIFVVSAGAILFLAFQMPFAQYVESPQLRRLLMGVVVAFPLVAIIYSPWGRQSGAHINPAVTIAFYRLGKIRGWDAIYYILFQFGGAVFGLSLAGFLLGPILAAPSVNYATISPGATAHWIAFLAEFSIAFVLMAVVLIVMNSRRWRSWTGVTVGLLVALYMVLESPISGTGLNPARCFASSLHAGVWGTVWIYLLAPVLGMLLASSLYVSVRGSERVICAKMHHPSSGPCHFHCGFALRSHKSSAPKPGA